MTGAAGVEVEGMEIDLESIFAVEMVLFEDAACRQSPFELGLGISVSVKNMNFEKSWKKCSPELLDD